MGDFPSETVGNRELGGIPSSHREGFTSPSTHPPTQGKGVPHAHLCPLVPVLFRVHSHPWKEGCMIPISEMR